MYFLFISLPWLSNELLWSMNKLKQGLWCTIWLSYIYIYIYIYIYYIVYIYIYIYFWAWNINLSAEASKKTIFSSLASVAALFKWNFKNVYFLQDHSYVK